MSTMTRAESIRETLRVMSKNPGLISYSTYLSILDNLNSRMESLEDLPAFKDSLTAERVVTLSEEDAQNLQALLAAHHPKSKDQIGIEYFVGLIGTQLGEIENERRGEIDEVKGGVR